MQEKWFFADASKMYSQKLNAERCLLALVRHGASQALEKSDINALEALRQMLVDASKVDYDTDIASLSSDASTNVNLVVNLLLAAKLVTTLPAVKVYLQELIDTISKVENDKVVGKKQKGNIFKFVQALSTNLGSEIAAMVRDRNPLVNVL